MRDLDEIERQIDDLQAEARQAIHETVKRTVDTIAYWVIFLCAVWFLAVSYLSS